MVCNRTVYGERPITELFALLSNEWERRNILDNIELMDGLDSKFKAGNVNEIILEAPLRKKYGCVDLAIIGDDY